MLIGRHSFIRQSKLSDVAGRIDYISNPKRQEYLYATYQTEGATPEFWKNLARENQLDFIVELRLFHRLVKRDIYQIFTNFEEKDISKQTKLCRVKLKSRYHKNDKKRSKYKKN